MSRAQRMLDLIQLLPGYRRPVSGAVPAGFSYCASFSSATVVLAAASSSGKKSIGPGLS